MLGVGFGMPLNQARNPKVLRIKGYLSTVEAT